MTVQIHAVTMPKWGIEMQQGTIVEWHALPGQPVNKGDALIDVETDKIINSVEVPVAGVLRRMIGAKGQVLPVGALIGVVGGVDASDAEIDDFIARFRPAQIGPDLAQPHDATRGVVIHGGDPTATPAASAHAVRRAAELGIDLGNVPGSGRNGRISLADVEAHAHTRAATATFDPAASVRARAAQRLVDAVQQIPHFRLSIDLDVTQLEAQRGEMEAVRVKVTLTHCLILATALALCQHPKINAQYVDGRVVSAARADIALVVATERGLLTPVIRDAQRKSVAAIAHESQELVRRAKLGRLTMPEIAGGTFTLSNLGMFGVIRFDAIINAPQVAILALGAATERVVVRNAAPLVARVITVTLSCDHRFVDGVDGAAFLATLKHLVEEQRLLAKNGGA